MNRLSKCINFQIKNMIKSSVIFLAIYFAVSLALYLLFAFSINNSSGGSINSGFYMGTAIFLFVFVIASYKEMFNYLLMFGNTRKNILLSSIVTSAVMSLSFSVISSISIQVEDVLSKSIGNGRFGNINLINLMYEGSGVFSVFIWLTMFFFLICSFSLLYASLAYKFGSVFITVFWVCFGLSFIGLPILFETNNFKVLADALAFFFRIGSEHGVLLAPVNFVAASAIFSAVAYLASRRQPQNA